MGRLLLNWLVSAVSLLIVAHLIPGIAIDGFFTALIAALVIGLVNATLGLALKIVTFPLTILTLGIFLLVINGLMIMLASGLVRGFYVHGFLPAFIGAIVLSLLGMLIRAMTKSA